VLPRGAPRFFAEPVGAPGRAGRGGMGNESAGMGNPHEERGRGSGIILEYIF
jgi:hypothetical protein